MARRTASLSDDFASKAIENRKRLATVRAKIFESFEATRDSVREGIYTINRDNMFLMISNFVGSKVIIYLKYFIEREKKLEKVSCGRLLSTAPCYGPVKMTFLFSTRLHGKCCWRRIEHLRSQLLDKGKKMTQIYFI